MNLNKEKFLSLVSNVKTNTVERNQERIRNREMSRVSSSIALKVLNRMDDLGWDNNRLSQELDIPLGFVNKIISGKYNLSLNTLMNIQRTLNIKIIISDIYLGYTKTV